MIDWKHIEDTTALWHIEDDADYPDVLLAMKHDERWGYGVGFWDGNRISPYSPFEAVPWTHYALISPPELQPHDHVEREAEN